jgi:hypothetical protein
MWRKKKVLKTKEREYLLQKKNSFKVGDQIRFRYKGKSHSGTVEKIKRKIINRCC